MAADDPELDGIPGTKRGMGIRVRRSTKLMGVTGLGVVLPRPVDGEGAGQRTVVEVPARCPRKGCDSLHIRQPLCRGCGRPTAGERVCLSCGRDGNDDRRVACGTCGWDSYIVTPPQAQVVVPVEREKGLLPGNQAVVKLEGRPRPPARPRRDRRKKPIRYRPEPPAGFRRNGGVQVFPYSD